MAKRPKILVLFDVGEPTGLNVDYTEDLKSPTWKTERHVLNALRSLGYPFSVLGVHDNTALIREMISRFQPDVVFNMVEQFANSLSNETHVTSYLELQGVPITGCGSIGIALAKNKIISKKIASFHGIRVPRFTVHEPGKIISILSLIHI